MEGIEQPACSMSTTLSTACTAASNYDLATGKPARRLTRRSTARSTPAPDATAPGSANCSERGPATCFLCRDLCRRPGRVGYFSSITEERSWSRRFESCRDALFHRVIPSDMWPSGRPIPADFRMAPGKSRGAARSPSTPTSSSTKLRPVPPYSAPPVRISMRKRMISANRCTTRSGARGSVGGDTRHG